MKKQDSDSAPTIVAAKSMGIRFTNNKGVPIYDIANAQEEDLGTSLVNSNKPAKFDDTPFSKVVQIGYVCMLILRVGIEWFSLNLELNLGRHQSQKGGLIDSLKLKEMWYRKGVMRIKKKLKIWRLAWKFQAEMNKIPC